MQRTKVFLGLLVCLGTAMSTNPQAQSPETSSFQTLMVIPFSDASGTATDTWIGEGLAETVSAGLNQLEIVVVVTTTRHAEAVSETGGLLQLGQELDLDWIVTGEFQRSGERVQVNATLIDVGSGESRVTTVIDGTFDELFDVQDQVVTDLESMLRKHLDPLMAAESTRTTDVGATEIDHQRRATQNDRPRGIGPDRLRVDDTTIESGGSGMFSGRPRIRPTRTMTPPTIDGRLTDDVWRTATMITELVQQSPLDGAPATEETEIYLAYDRDHLYFGFYLHYSDPSLMRANRVDRDRAAQDDLMTIYFDTFMDQQRVYDFDINAYNVQGDGVINGANQRGGPIPFADRSWDALFDSGAQIVEDGYTAEMAIPFKSVRYPQQPPGVPHQWGFQIVREVKGRDRENDVWAPMSRNVQSFMAQMGILEGMTDLSTSRNIEILPTFTAIRYGELDNDSTAFVNQDTMPEGGVNVKYGITSNLTADFTYNPDFSQIESDRPQIEVNQRYPLFFDELRPFFLEGADIFEFTSPVNLVNTRTIIDPRYGGKLTGKVGRTTLGLLIVDDEAPGKRDDKNDPAFGETAQFVIGRARYDLYSESHIGALVTDREFLDGYSRLGSIDGQFRFSPTSRLNLVAAQSQHRDEGGVERNGHMFGLLFQRNGRNLVTTSFIGQVDPNFRTDVGFVRRVDARNIRQRISYRWYPEHWLINWGPSANYQRSYRFDGVLQDEESRTGLDFSFAKQISAGISSQRVLERFGGIDFWKWRHLVRTSINTSRSISAGFSTNWGDEIFFDPDNPFLGQQVSIGVNTTVRPVSSVQSRVSLNTARFTDIRTGKLEVFDVKIYRGLTTWQLNDRFLLRNITEYNTFSRKLDFNILATYRVDAGTAFYVGYDDHYRQADLIDDERYFTTDLRRTNRAVFMKLQYLFRY